MNPSWFALMYENEASAAGQESDGGCAEVAAPPPPPLLHLFFKSAIAPWMKLNAASSRFVLEIPLVAA